MTRIPTTPSSPRAVGALQHAKCSTASRLFRSGTDHKVNAVYSPHPIQLLPGPSLSPISSLAALRLGRDCALAKGTSAEVTYSTARPGAWKRAAWGPPLALPAAWPWRQGGKWWHKKGGAWFQNTRVALNGCREQHTGFPRPRHRESGGNDTELYACTVIGDKPVKSGVITLQLVTCLTPGS